jgi:hypothetical protein
MEFLILLIIFSLIGAAIGQARGRTAAGFLWAFLLGPIGWLIIILGPNPKKKEKEEAEALEKMMARRRQDEHMKKIEALASQKSFSAPSVTKFRISKDSVELGEFDIPSIKLMMKSGKITVDDLYYDEAIGDWVPLSAHESI